MTTNKSFVLELWPKAWCYHDHREGCYVVVLEQIATVFARGKTATLAWGEAAKKLGK